MHQICNFFAKIAKKYATINLNIEKLWSRIINITWRNNQKMDVVAGINEDELSLLSLEILDYSDRITEIFDKIDSCMDRLPNYYQGTPCVALMNYYKQLTTYYSIIRDNIVTYSDDLIALIKKMQENDKFLTTLFQNYTDDTKNKMKSIIN